MFGFGNGLAFVPLTAASLDGVEPADAGAASGLVNVMQQVGGALGLAVITTVSTSHVGDLVAGGMPAGAALVEGFHRGLLVAAVFAGVNMLVALISPQLVPDAEQIAEAVAV